MNETDAFNTNQFIFDFIIENWQQALLYAGLFFFWLMMILHIVQSEKGRAFRTKWVLILVATNFCGALIYFIFLYLRSPDRRIYSVSRLEEMENEISKNEH